MHLQVERTMFHRSLGRKQQQTGLEKQDEQQAVPKAGVFGLNHAYTIRPTRVVCKYKRPLEAFSTPFGN